MKEKKLSLKLKCILCTLSTLFVLGTGFIGCGEDDDDEAYETIDIPVVQDKLMLTYEGMTTENGWAATDIIFNKPEEIHSIKTKVTINDLNRGDISAGLRVGGHFYSDSFGDVWAAVYIGDIGNGIEGWWDIFSNVGGNKLGYGSLVSPGGLSIGNTYNISIAFDEILKKFTFSVNNQIASYPAIDYQGPPNENWKTILSQVSGDPNTGPATSSFALDCIYVNNDTTPYYDFANLNISNWCVNHICEDCEGSENDEDTHEDIGTSFLGSWNITYNVDGSGCAVDDIASEQTVKILRHDNIYSISSSEFGTAKTSIQMIGKTLYLEQFIYYHENSDTWQNVNGYYTMNSNNNTLNFEGSLIFLTDKEGTPLCSMAMTGIGNRLDES